MRLVLDASVAIAAARPTEPHHGLARARVERILRADDELVVPAIFAFEVGGALSRCGEAEAKVRAYVDALTAPPHEVIAIGAGNARRIRNLAIATRLRGADAAYVWLAAREGIPLCTLDGEIAARGEGRCQIVGP